MLKDRASHTKDHKEGQAFSIGFRRGNFVLVNDSVDTIHFYGDNTYEECEFRLYPNEGLPLTTTTPKFIRIQNQKLKLFSYTPFVQGVENERTSDQISVSLDSPRANKAKLSMDRC